MKIKISAEKILLAALILLFLTLYFTLSWYNRLSHDDLMFLYAVKNYGVLKATWLNYTSWNTRWAGVLLANFFFGCNSIPHYLFLFHLLSLSVLLLSVNMFLKNAFTNFFSVSLSTTSTITYTFIFIIIFFANTFCIGDVWFWLNASCMFLWNVSITCFAFGFILSKNKSVFQKIILSLCGIYIGGCSEPFTILLLILVVTVLYFLRKANKDSSEINSLFVFLSAVACGFLISFAGEGNSLRKAALPHVTFIFKQWIFIKVMTKFFLLYFPQKFIFSFLLSSPFLLLGCRLSAERMHGLHLKRILSILFISIFLFAFITFYIIVYLMSEMGPERAWTGISFFMSVMFATCFFVCGYYKVIRKRFAQNLFFTSMLLIVFSAPWYIYYQHKTVKKYSEAYDNRILLLENLKRSNFTGIHKLEPLLPSGLLHSNEISNDTSYFTNQQLKLFLDLPFAVSLKEP